MSITDPKIQGGPAWDDRLLAALPVAVCIADAGTLQIVAYNRLFREGVSSSGAAGELLGSRLVELLPAEARAAVLQAHGRVSETGQAEVCPVESLRWSGQERFLERTIAPLFDAAGRIGWHVVTLRDVTWEVQESRREAELTEKVRAVNEHLALTALRAQEAAEQEARARRLAQQQALELNAIFAALSDPVFVSDEHGVIIRANSAACIVLGRDPVGQLWSELVAGLGVCRSDGAPLGPDELPLLQALRGRPVEGLNVQIRDAAGGRHTVMISATPLRTGGQAFGAVAVWRDVTRLEALLEELRRKTTELAEADRNKDEFLAMLGHELRNPLAAVANAAYLLQRPEADAIRCDRMVEVILRQTGQLRRMVDDLLDVARITRGRVELKRSMVRLSDVIDRVVENLRPFVEGRQHNITVSMPDGLPLLDADPARLEQVLTNLLHNAAKYTPPGGRIALSGARDGEQVVLQVQDNGVGIAPELLPRVFDLFVQADHTLARSGGLGLGLTLARRLIELHGGTLEAFSQGVGRGSEFVVRLPLPAALPDLPEQATWARPEGETQDDARPDHGGGSGSGSVARVLIVEDNADLAEMLAALVALLGHEVEAAPDGRTGLARAEVWMPDVVLLDIGLPDIDGYEVARRLRAGRAPGEPPRVVAVTGYGQPSDRRRAEEAGCERHLVKPVSLEQLGELLGSGLPDLCLRDGSGEADAGRASW